MLVAGDAFPGISQLLPAAAAGIAGLVGLGALYRGFAIGAMGIVAPISAASPIVPLAVDAAKGDAPAALQWLGIALVLTGIGVLSREPSGAGQRRVAAGAGLAVVAALGFGLFVVGLDAGADESAAWAVVAARTASVSIAVAVALITTRASSRLDVCSRCSSAPASSTPARTSSSRRPPHTALPAIVAVFGALYPVVTIVLAWAVLGERLSRSKRVGGVVALAGAAFVAAG